MYQVRRSSVRESHLDLWEGPLIRRDDAARSRQQHEIRDTESFQIDSDHSGPVYPSVPCYVPVVEVTLQMIRAIWTCPSFALSRILRRGLYTTTPVYFPEGHGLLPTSQSPITPKPHFFNSVSTDGKQLPTYRIIDGVGNVIEGAELPEACPNICAPSIQSTYFDAASLMNN